MITKVSGYGQAMIQTFKIFFFKKRGEIDLESLETLGILGNAECECSSRPRTFGSLSVHNKRFMDADSPLRVLFTLNI
jgi:hypothetical protein